MLTEKEVQRFYEQESDVYDQLRFKSPQGIYSSAVQKSIVLELVGDCNGKSILEIGSGTGRLTGELVKRGAYLVCVDLSRKMHEYSRLALDNVSTDYLVMSGANLAFADNVFDGCLAINIMSHVRCHERILREVGRVLKKNGVFVANFPNWTGLYFPVGVAVNCFKRSLQAPVYSRWYSLGEVFRTLENAGLKPVRTLGQMVFPRERCPDIMFRLLRGIDFKVRDSGLKLFSGNLFVKSHKLRFG